MTNKELVQLACPTYKGRKILQGTTAPKHLDSYWDEGYRSYYYLVNLDQKSVYQVHSNHPGFEPDQVRVLDNELPKHYAMVVHQFAGTKQYAVVYQGTGNDQYPVLKA